MEGQSGADARREYDRLTRERDEALARHRVGDPVATGASALGLVALVVALAWVFGGWALDFLRWIF
jgi:hypothetical protein